MRLLPRLFYVAIPLFWSLLPYVISEDHLLPFKLCGPDELGVEVIRLNAWPLVPGRELTITAIYTPNVTVTGGEALVTVHVLGIPLTERRAICHESGVHCPLLPHHSTTSVIHAHVPGLTPGFGVDARVELFDGRGRRLTCLDARVEVRTHPLIGVPSWSKPSLALSPTLSPDSPTTTPFASSSSPVVSSLSSLLSSLPAQSAAVALSSTEDGTTGIKQALDQFIKLRHQDFAVEAQDPRDESTSDRNGPLREDHGDRIRLRRE
ncbi:npc21 dicdi ame: phosphatidylglycerol phosphatidylinositol transfer protein 1 [Nannochloropsis gaditana CCMP526]|uniref:npc21 dicdi ame: phosphatidylglycerol phosphatidylinositol transfer protein 1 n=1 Tax=Nannochloropsis gaditana (strain CCMP526) TaxID=1093141 RepID=UPI00029F7CB5|nr:npc21 dicdi ame: phosphatidylglycerol phosphatidylinositol transfer protein 1 [Nannochloropsis gaditana CCMP526]EKU22977.1 npc21 dicdi ame: phosphatidylglycerol phosphatidylinositol transfer protein 1 [Nannochloropsis gaditana CCMP526]|eukprot:XP_005853383.1 npc21 dicdi ame: phosphatidylglycerol phosphatidylinositol transfer protein 1 [Nannochloropsis gaditana CCMP526]